MSYFSLVPTTTAPHSLSDSYSFPRSDIKTQNSNFLFGRIRNIFERLQQNLNHSPYKKLTYLGLGLFSIFMVKKMLSTSVFQDIKKESPNPLSIEMVQSLSESKEVVELKCSLINYKEVSLNRLENESEKEQLIRELSIPLHVSKIRTSENKKGFIFACRYRQEVIGLIHIYPNKIEKGVLETQQKEGARIHFFYLKQTYRNQGFSYIFVGLLKDWARKQGYRELSIQMSNQVWATGDYQLQGFNIHKAGKVFTATQKIFPLRLIWIRHGQVDLPAGINYFPLEKQLKLTEKAKEEAAYIATHLKIPISFPLFVSPLQRALETAQILAQKAPFNSLQLIECEELSELFPTCLINHSVDNIKKIYGEDFWLRWQTKPIEFPSIDIHLTLKNLNEKIVQLMRLPLASDYRVIVSHGVLHNAFLLNLLEGNLNFCTKRVQLDNLKASIFEFDPCFSEFTVTKINTYIEEDIC